MVALSTAVLSRKKAPSPSSHFLDEERMGGRIESQELSAEPYVGILKDPKGIYICLWFLHMHACRNHK